MTQTATKLSDLARHLKISRNTLYKHIADPKTDLDILISAGLFMNYDFGVFIPELAKKVIPEDVQENLSYKIKFMEMAEKMILVMEDREKYRKEAEDLKKEIEDLKKKRVSVAQPA